MPETITVDDVTFRVGDTLVYPNHEDKIVDIEPYDEEHTQADDPDPAAYWLVLEGPDRHRTRGLAGSIAVAVHGDWSETELRKDG